MINNQPLLIIRFAININRRIQPIRLTLYSIAYAILQSAKYSVTVFNHHSVRVAYM